MIFHAKYYKQKPVIIKGMNTLLPVKWSNDYLISTHGGVKMQGGLPRRDARNNR
jgi:hypothetical protein